MWRSLNPPHFTALTHTTLAVTCKASADIRGSYRLAHRETH